ncbi:MAG: glycogen synthase GlgA [Gammaproteobacteria bacterium]
MKKILFVTSEAHPFIKTGGLADVSGSLPKALAELGQDVRLILPYYHAVKIDRDIRHLSRLRVNNCDVELLETRLPGTEVRVVLVNYPALYGTPGNPYVDEYGNPWSDSAERFALLCRIAVEVAMNRAWLDWKADIVHCNDWQSGLVPALLSLEHSRPRTVFTIHNLAYQGLFPARTFATLNIPGQLWHPNGLEFFGMLSFIKGGLAYSDHLTTVSPSYALEIQTPEFGYGLEGLLSHRQHRLTGILNGIDVEHWNPETDPYLAHTYSAETLDKKHPNKSALQHRVGLPVVPSLPVIGLISRLVQQKGIDLVLECLPQLAALPLQFVLLGSGDKEYEQRLLNFAHLYPQKISITIGYDEHLAHLVEAGADLFLMPSRFEPCGLNQMYSQRYGTIPIVRHTGGLADTVTDALPHTLADGSASGVVFNQTRSGSLLEAAKRGLLLYSLPEAWKKMQKTGMRKDFSWKHSAEEYLHLYTRL